MGEVTWLGGAILPESPEEKAGGKKCSPPGLSPSTQPLGSRASETCKVRCGWAGNLSSQLFWFPFEIRERTTAWTCSLCGRLSMSLEEQLHCFANCSGDSHWEACSKPHFWRNQEISLVRQTSHFSTQLKACLLLSALSFGPRWKAEQLGNTVKIYLKVSYLSQSAGSLLSPGRLGEGVGRRNTLSSCCLELFEQSPGSYPATLLPFLNKAATMA